MYMGIMMLPCYMVMYGHIGSHRLWKPIGQYVVQTIEYKFAYFQSI